MRSNKRIINRKGQVRQKDVLGAGNCSFRQTVREGEKGPLLANDPLPTVTRANLSPGWVCSVQPQVGNRCSCDEINNLNQQNINH